MFTNLFDKQIREDFIATIFYIFEGILYTDDIFREQRIDIETKSQKCRIFSN